MYPHTESHPSPSAQPLLGEENSSLTLKDPDEEESCTICLGALDDKVPPVLPD